MKTDAKIETKFVGECLLRRRSQHKVLWACPWGVLWRSWALLGRSWGPLGRTWGALGALLGGPGALLGQSWGDLGRSWALLGAVGAHLEALGSILTRILIDFCSIFGQFEHAFESISGYSFDLSCLGFALSLSGFFQIWFDVLSMYCV